MVSSYNLTAELNNPAPHNTFFIDSPSVEDDFLTVTIVEMGTWWTLKPNE